MGDTAATPGAESRPAQLAVLHVGAGFTPWLINGLVRYAEDLMQGQVAAGARVGYFFVGRQYPLFDRPHLHTWKRKGVRMFEWMNSPIVVGAHRGTPDPEMDLASPQAEAVFQHVLQTFSPMIVHIHDLGGFPSSLIPIARATGTATVMTLHDYHILCPTIKLFDVDGNRCYRPEPGAQCVRCCVNAPHDNEELRVRTLAFEVKRAAALVPAGSKLLATDAVSRIALDTGARIASLRGRRPQRAPSSEEPSPPAPTADAFQRRRDVNVERLNQLDAVFTNSERTGDLYVELGLDRQRLRRTHLTANHLAELRVNRVAGTSPVVTFAALNVAVSVQKGSLLLVEALNELRAKDLMRPYRVIVGGWVPDDIRAHLRDHDEITYTGPYRTTDLNAILREVDVGLIPSVWEEVYGYLGLEYLAKAIPVMANALGGLTEYVRDGRNGWLNHELGPRGLADLMTAAINHPEEIQSRSRQAAAERDQIVQPFSTHIEEVDSLYHQVLVTATPPRQAAVGT